MGRRRQMEDERQVVCDLFQAWDAATGGWRTAA